MYKIFTPLRYFSTLTPHTLQLSFTKLETFLLCPLKYKFQFVLKMLPKPNIFLVHGSALHATIAAYAENIIKNEKNSLESLQHLFVQEWHLSKEKQKIQVSQEEQDEFIKKGQQQIRNFFFRESCRQSRRPYLVERKFVVDVN